MIAILLRLFAIAFLLVVLFFSIYGFLATFELLQGRERLTWQALYAVLASGSVFGIVQVIRKWRRIG